MKKTLTMWTLGLLLTCLSFGAQAQSQSQLEKDLNDFRAWMRQKANLADSTIQQEWPTVKKEYKEKTYRLDQNSRKLSDSSRAEYDDMKARYQEWEERNETRTAVNLDGEKLAMWERRLTGTTQINRMKAANLRDAFTQALEYTREHRRSWSLRDWDYAEFAFGELNTRKSELLNQLNNGDKIKIAALQVEFATLKKGREAKDAYETMREQR